MVNSSLEGKEDMLKELDELFNMQVLWDKEEACIYFKGRVICYMQLPTNNPEEAMRIVRSVIKIYQKALVNKRTYKMRT